MDELTPTPEKPRWYHISRATEPGSTWSLRTISKEGGYKTIIDTGWALVIIGILNIALTSLIADIWLDGLLYMFAGTLLAYKKKTWAAWIAVSIVGLEFVGIIYNKIVSLEGGNIFLAAILFFFSIKSLNAVRFLNGETVLPMTRWQKVGEKIFPILFWLSAVAVAIVIALLIIGGIAWLNGEVI